MGFFNRSKLKSKQSILTLDFNQPPPPPQPDLPEAAGRPAPPLRPASAQAFVQQNAIPHRPATRASQSVLQERQPSSFDRKASTLQPVTESQDEDRAQSSQSRAGLSPVARKAVGDYDAFAEWTGRSPQGANGGGGDEREVLDLKERVRSQQEEIERTRANLRTALQRLAQTDGIATVNEELLQERESFARQAKAREEQQEREIRGLRQAAGERNALARRLEHAEKNCTGILGELERFTAEARKKEAKQYADISEVRKRWKEKSKAEVDLKEQLDQCEKRRVAEMTRLTEECKAKEARKDFEIQGLKRKLGEKTAAVTSLASQLEKLESRLGEMTAKSQADEAHVQSFRRDMEELQMQMQKKMADVKATTDEELRRFEVVNLAQADTLRREIEEARRTSTAAEKRHRGELAQKNEQLRQRKVEAERAVASTQELRLQVQDLQAQKDDTETTMHELEQRLRDVPDMQRRIDSLRNEEREMHRMKGQDENRILQLEHQVQEAQHRAARAVDDLAKQMSDLRDEKESTIRELELSREELRVQMQELRKDKERDERRVQALLEQLREHSSRATQDMDDLRKQMSDVREARDSRISELNQQLQESTSTNEETRLILNRTRNELNTEKRKASQAAAEMIDTSRKMEFVQQQCAVLQEKKTGLQERLDSELRTKEQTSLRIKESIMRMLGTTHVSSDDVVMMSDP